MSQPVAGPSRWRRLAGWTGTAAFVYAGTQYLLQGLASEREKRAKDEKSRENLRLRFTELQDNSNFTVMMLLPNVASQIFAALDVEGITAVLQQKTTASKTTPAPAPSSLNESFDKLTPSEIHVNGIKDEQTNGYEAENNGRTGANGISEPNGAPSEHAEAIAASQELTSSALGLSSALPPIEETSLEPERRLDPRTKLELWQEIKALAFTRTISALYLVTILTLQTSVTLNLLGRADYLASVIDLARERGTAGQVVVDDLVAAYAALPATASDADSETDQKFLTFSWYLLHKGWPMLVERVRATVDELVGETSLKAQITYDELCELFDRIRQRVDADADGKPFNFWPIYFPPNEEEEVSTLSSGGIPSHRAYIDERLRHLLDETRTFLSSEDGRKVQQCCLDVSFTRMTNSLESSFRSGVSTMTSASSAAEAKQSSRLTVVGGRSARLANLLPSIAKASHAVLEGFPNEYVEELKEVAELKAFSAIVFSSFR